MSRECEDNARMLQDKYLPCDDSHHAFINQLILIHIVLFFFIVLTLSSKMKRTCNGVREQTNQIVEQILGYGSSLQSLSNYSL
jgi:lysylphosphatidylglycerol synthetase-like protein (DUF2156 family)